MPPLKPFHEAARPHQTWNRTTPSDLVTVAIEFVVLVVSAHTGTDMGEVGHELDLADPFDLFEAELVLTAQTQRCPVHDGLRLEHRSGPGGEMAARPRPGDYFCGYS